MFKPVTLEAARRRRMGQMDNVAIRFEVTDEFGEKFLPATIDIRHNDGRLVISKNADIGGNVSLTPRELDDGLRDLGIIGDRGFTLTASVSAPGYLPWQQIIWDRSQGEDQWIDQLYNVALVESKTTSYVTAGVITALLIAVGVAS